MSRSRALLLVLLCGLGLLLPELWDRLRSPETDLIEPAVAGRLADPALPARGGRAPDVTIVLFTDYRCPVCRRTEAAIAAVMARDPGIRLVYRDWPILGEDSVRAARAALASRWQGRYPAFHDALMAAPGPLDEGAIAAVARGAELDPERLARDLTRHGPAIDRMLGDTAREALALGLPGTPGVIVGRQAYAGGLDAAAIGRLVAAARVSR